MSNLVTPKISNAAELFELLDRGGFFKLDLRISESGLCIEFDKRYSLAVTGVDRDLLRSYILHRLDALELLQKALDGSASKVGVANG